MTWEEYQLEKARRKNLLNKNPFSFFGKEFNFGPNRQYLTQDEYEATMEKKWRNPWHTYGKEAGKTAPSYADRILREEAVRRENAAMYGPDAMGPGRAGIAIDPRTAHRRPGGQVQSAGDPSKSATLQTMMSGMMPMDMTRYYKERDTSFAGAMAKTLASGLAKAAKPKPFTLQGRKYGGGQRTFTPDPYEMASWVAPTAPSGYGETVDPTIETYLRPWRLKHGYT